MGKHLSVEEKLNASKDMEQTKAKMMELRFERGQIKYFLKRKYCEPKRAEYEARLVEIGNELQSLNLKRLKLDYFLSNIKNSKYGGNYAKNGVCYKLFKKKRCEFTAEEAREYNRYMRARAKEKANETH